MRWVSEPMLLALALAAGDLLPPAGAGQRPFGRSAGRAVLGSYASEGARRHHEWALLVAARLGPDGCPGTGSSERRFPAQG